jgi:ribonuclease HII
MLNWDIENEQIAKGYSIICGVDEAGRGPLAGPVTAAACILPYGFNMPDLKDSKLLTPHKREAMYDVITKYAVSYAVGYASVAEIDKFNIVNAVMLAMNRAVETLSPQPDMALIDGNISRGFEVATRTVIRGDTLSPSIAAASILAKVSRDRMCVNLEKLYPMYHIAKHKGYATALHKDMLRIYRPTPIHRKSFMKFLYWTD